MRINILNNSYSRCVWLMVLVERVRVGVEERVGVGVRVGEGHHEE